MENQNTPSTPAAPEKAPLTFQRATPQPAKPKAAPVASKSTPTPLKSATYNPFNPTGAGTQSFRLASCIGRDDKGKPRTITFPAASAPRIYPVYDVDTGRIGLSGGIAVSNDTDGRLPATAAGVKAFAARVIAAKMVSRNPSQDTPEKLLRTLLNGRALADSGIGGARVVARGSQGAGATRTIRLA